MTRTPVGTPPLVQKLIGPSPTAEISRPGTYVGEAETLGDGHLCYIDILTFVLSLSGCPSLKINRDRRVGTWGGDREGPETNPPARARCSLPPKVSKSD